MLNDDGCNLRAEYLHVEKFDNAQFLYDNILKYAISEYGKLS